MGSELHHRRYLSTGARDGVVPVDQHADLGVKAARQIRSDATLYVGYGMENH